MASSFKVSVGAGLPGLLRLLELTGADAGLRGEPDRYLTATAGPASSMVIFSAPASLFQRDQYYVIVLEALDGDGRQKNTRTFTFYLIKR